VNLHPIRTVAVFILEVVLVGGEKLTQDRPLWGRSSEGEKEELDKHDNTSR